MSLTPGLGITNTISMPDFYVGTGSHTCVASACVPIPSSAS